MHDLDRSHREMDWRPAGQRERPGGAPGWPGGGEQGERAGDELEEMELASQLLEVTNEQELEQFLGGLLGRVGALAGRVLRSDTGQALQGILRQAAGQALPMIGRGIGGWIAPGRGGDVGARLASQAGQFLGLELEGLSAEDREFETARQFVRFAPGRGGAVGGGRGRLAPCAGPARLAGADQAAARPPPP
jgi:hypothetical protein